ncbi:hypothetical protein [Mycolicibacterium austroafricanum]|uniref:hypothetical protein n=1 Tax=Mycolicibacterium austroafricanum TaxID=39687 RepID=UPI001F46D36A|nr:hypothetical protein [Mycolicibacterium austroafricanum]
MARAVSLTEMVTESSVTTTESRGMTTGAKSVRGNPTLLMSRSSCETVTVPDLMPNGRFTVVFSVVGLRPGGTGNDSVVWLVSPKNHRVLSEPASVNDSVVVPTAGSEPSSGCVCAGGATRMSSATAVMKAPT